MTIETTNDLNVAVLAYINTVLKTDPLCYQQTEEFLKERSYRRDALKNDRAVSENEEMKLTIQMPDILGGYVFKAFPEILENKKNLYSFMRAFPQFTASPDPDKTKYI